MAFELLVEFIMFAYLEVVRRIVQPVISDPVEAVRDCGIVDKTVRLSDCQTVRLSDCHTVILSDCLTV